MKANLIISFILIVFSIQASENLIDQLHRADKLFSEEQYYDTITEYKRLQFFDDKNEYSFESNYKIGVAYKKGGYYENAIRYLTKAKLDAVNDEEEIETQFQIIRTNILRSTFERSFQLLDELEKNSNEEKYRNEINYWRGWTFMLADKWDSAATHFSKISGDHELKKLCKQVENEKYSVTFARVISYILPGAGQFYTGNYISGFISLAWNVLWGYLTVDAFIADRAFDGAAIGSLLWLRFYRGNIQNAGKLAENENIKIANEAFLYLMENYKGEKP